MVDKVIRMADKAQANIKKATDSAPKETLPYDKKYYGNIGDIQEFKENHKQATLKLLKTVGGRFVALKPNDNAFWKPHTNVLSKEFVNRFPKFANMP